MTRRILSQRMAKWALLAAPRRGDGEPYQEHVDACIVQANQIADDFHQLKAMGFDEGASYCMALMVGGYEAGRLGGPFDGARGT